jgi:tetratricopeptide (TPR) repeat protein
MEEAESQFRHAIALRPSDARYHFALGVVLAQRQNCPSARSEFTEALSLNPGLTRAQEQSDKCGIIPAVAGIDDAPVRLPAARLPLPIPRPVASTKGP